MDDAIAAGLTGSRIRAVADSRTWRSVLAIFGGYAFTNGYVALLSVLLVYAGMDRGEAMWWPVLTAFLVFTAVVIWAAATTRPLLTSAIIIGGAAAMIAIAPWLAAL
ncbi:MAG: iron uptake protein [Pseudomonadota bacterium]